MFGFEGIDGDMDAVRCRLMLCLVLEKLVWLESWFFKTLMRSEKGHTHSSLSLRPRFRRLSVFSSTPCPLLCSMAIRNCSSSSYAASRLFIVERRFVLSDMALWRENFVSLVVFESGSWFEGLGDVLGEASS